MPLLRDGTVLRKIPNYHRIDESLSEDISSLAEAPIEHIAQTVEGLNTTITFTFKAVEGEETQPCPPNEGCTILCAEDNTVLGHMLRKFGQNYVMTENGRDAVEVYKSNPERFPCILMDTAMPIMDGREATRRIRAFESNRPGHRRALIVGVGPFHMFTPSLSEFPSDGFDLMMPKPFRVPELYEMFMGGPETNIISLYGSLTEEEKRAYPRSVAEDVRLGDDPRSIAIRNEMKRRIPPKMADTPGGHKTIFFTRIIVKVVKASEDDDSFRR
ncbi:hypothetical protein O1611_g264 [Lasiodiplodia mahajangana]|uniref:Uncharacterized protein n=1 Tax=Lasiodiplodia mahajangana TaxID=1108764 RepID=A0ACC2K0U0_9PEZI|nr:hypothetical protein O1611_g264 [Lasiodiplodia mahajangana]